MFEKIIKVPDHTHPITIERTAKRVVVLAAGKVIADTLRALTLHEADHRSVHYIPRRDVRLDALQSSPTNSYCPYKGEASHFHISKGGECLTDAAWTYQTPYWAVAEIENYLAFDVDRVDRIEILPASGSKEH
jgi:uncharacterized protein (DUF427 family)